MSPHPAVKCSVCETVETGPLPYVATERATHVMLDLKGSICEIPWHVRSHTQGRTVMYVWAHSKGSRELTPTPSPCGMRDCVCRLCRAAPRPDIVVDRRQ